MKKINFPRFLGKLKASHAEHHRASQCKKSSSFQCVKSYMSVVNFINNFRCSGFITAWENVCFIMWNGMPRLVVH